MEKGRTESLLLNDLLVSTQGLAHPNLIGMGADLVSVKRIEAAISRGGDLFLERSYTPAEIDYCRRAHFPGERFAVRWAAKEAAVKALGHKYEGVLSFRNIEIVSGDDSPPRLNFSGQLADFAASKGVGEAFVALSHEREYALAVVVLAGGKTHSPYPKKIVASNTL